MRQISQSAKEGFRISWGVYSRSARIDINSSFATLPVSKHADRGMNAPATRRKPSLAV